MILVLNANSFRVAVSKVDHSVVLQVDEAQENSLVVMIAVVLVEALAAVVLTAAVTGVEEVSMTVEEEASVEVLTAADSMVDEEGLEEEPLGVDIRYTVLSF